MRKLRFVLGFVFLFTSLSAQQVLSLKERAKLMEEIQQERFDVLLPELMKKNNTDMWVLITREYNEDPVVKTMLPPTWLNARRRTILVFSKNKTKGTIDRVAITRYPFGNLVPSIWNKEKQPDQWQALADYIVAQDPQTIGLNMSEDFALADGLAVTDYKALKKVLPSKFQKRIVSAQNLAVNWIETRTKKEMVLYNQLVEITHTIIKEAFSTAVITPGATTTDDVVWWLREKVAAMGLETWFHPTVDVQRSGDSDLYAFDSKSKHDVIHPGDLVHCDFGITYLGLNTDCQELAYVLKRGENQAPEFLMEALAQGNAVQDHLTNNFKEGRTGNQTLSLALSQAKEAGLRPQIYTHPLGLYGHSAGTAFGMWDAQTGVPGSGDHPLQYNTVYAIELNAKVYLKQWKKDIRIMLEEAGYYGSNGFEYVNKRQTELLLIGG